jgi:phospholipid-binding lipoprotein MlaA
MAEAVPENRPKPLEEPQLTLEGENAGPPLEPISDPLEPVNRVFFAFNDKLYFWVLKPVSTVYSKAVPENLRVAIGNFFDNLETPVRFVNCLLQGKFKGAGHEVFRFLVNSTAGFLGTCDVASIKLGIGPYREDLGQTLGTYGFYSGIYLCWPVFGPSSIRDTVGRGGDMFLDPLSFVYLQGSEWAAVRGWESVNGTSLVIGEYEDLKRAALDPYVAVKDAYHQNRESRIRK